jgi:lambda family phage portal protein
MARKKASGGRIASGTEQLTEAAMPAVVAPRRRLYEGAKISRLTSDWVTSSTSADAEISGSMIRLRNRARQLIRDSDYARQAVRAVRNNVIGTGIRMQAQVKMRRGGKPDGRINSMIEDQWKRWGRAKTCDTAGRLDFHEIERLAVGAMAESGEVFIRLVRQPFGGSSIPLALEVIEADLLDETKDGYLRQGEEWRLGVRVDEWKRPLAYAFLTRHPGDNRPAPIGREHVIVPAEDVIHLMVMERPQQTRGVTWFASAIKRLHHLAGYEEAEVVRARASSSLMGFVTSPEGELLGDDVYDGDRVSQFEPGVFKYLAPGEAVTVPQLDAPDGQFEPFVRAMLRAMAAGLGVSYETISRDFSQSNYSSSRLSLLEDRENWKALQQYLIHNLHTPIFEAWLDAAVAVGALPLPAYQQERERYQEVRWVPRGWEWVDPEKEGKAYRDAVRNGFMTQAEVVMSRGGDFYEVVEERAAEVEYINQLGLVFDVNPEQVAVGGMAQPSDPKAPGSGFDSDGSTDDQPAEESNPDDATEITEDQGP